MLSKALQRGIAARYLFSRKSHSIINIISVLSLLSVAIPAAAMVILLSVYNGLDGVLKSMYSNFDPQLKISVVKGKFFDPAPLLKPLSATDGIEAIAEVLDENVFFRYSDRSHIGALRGVDSTYRYVVDVDSMMVSGKYEPERGDLNQAIPGMGVAYNLGVNIAMLRQIQVYAPESASDVGFLPSSFFKRRELFPSGVFALDAETDGRYTIVPLRFARELLGKEKEVSFLAVKLKPNVSESRVKREIKSIVGPSYKVQTRFEQKESLYRIMRYEKIGIFFIVLLVAGIASLTLIGAVVMLITDKQDQLNTMRHFGATNSLLRGIFITQGVYISLGGVALGLTLGLILCYLQQYFGLISISSQSLLIDTYPIRVELTDILLILLSLVALNYIICKLTVRSVISNNSNNEK